MFLGKYGQKTTHYWRVVSPVAMLAFVLGFIFNWQIVDRRMWLFVPLAFYLAVQLATMAYFVPEQEALISNAGSLSRNVLRGRAHRWMFLNYFRNVAGILAYVFLMCAVLVP